MGLAIKLGTTYDVTQWIPFASKPDGTSSWVRVTETVPGTATMTAQIWDLNNTIQVPRLSPILVTDTTNNRNVFQGYVQKRKLSIIATYRVWEITCVDLNSVLDTSLVGTPNGGNWIESPPGVYTDVDPSAFVNGGSDADAVRALFSSYWHYPLTIDTTTYVEVTNPNIAFPDGVRWNRTTMRKAMDDIASLATPFTVGWIDADGYLHWTNKPQQGQPSGGGNYQGGTGTYTQTVGALPMLFPQTSVTINGGPNPPQNLVATPGDTVVSLSWGQPTLPQGPSVAPAPYNLSDEPDGATSISYENFSIEYDDSGAALSLYANGATDYTYNAGSGPVPDGITQCVPPKSSLPVELGVSGYGYYTANLSGTVLVYAVNNAGVIEQPGVPYTPPPGTTTYVNPTFVPPTSSGGGNFWEIKNNPNGTGSFPNGWRISQDQVSATPVTAPAPVVNPPTGSTAASLGVGGSGWVNNAGPTWLSRYIDLPDAISQSDRDLKGNQALQYMSQSLVRGTADVVRQGILYRAGMGLLITNHPAGLDNSLQMIMRVETTFVSGDDKRRAAMQWGTAPLGSIGLRRQAAQKPPVKPGATQHVVTAGNTTPMPGSIVTLRTQIANRAGESWPVQGKTVVWSMQVFDATGCDVTVTEAASGTNATGWSFVPSNMSLTDSNGASSVQLQLSTTAGLQYFASCVSPD